MGGKYFIQAYKKNLCLQQQTHMPALMLFAHVNLNMYWFMDKITIYLYPYVWLMPLF